MRGIRLAALVSLAALVLAGCSGPAGGDTKADPAGPIKVGVIPVADFAPVYLALDEGYFEEVGLNVEAQVMQNAASIVPAILNGQLQFGTSAVTPFLAAAQKGLPLRAVANAADVALDPADDVSALVVPKNSSVSAPAQLEGKTVAVNALSSIVHVTAAKAIADDGGDPAKVTFVAMPFPDMMTALAQGRVDAASVVEPFVGISTGAGATAIAHPYTASFQAGKTFALFFGSEAYAKANPEIVDKFAQALAKGSQTASEHPEKVSAVLVKYGKVDPAVAKNIQQPGYGTSVDPAALNSAATVMQELGFLPGQVDAEKLVWKKP